MASSRIPSISPYAKLRDSWPGRVYTSHLKKYSAFSRCAKWIWRNGYPLYIAMSLFNREQKRWRTLGKLTEFTRKKSSPTYRLVDACSIEMPVPAVFPACDQHYLLPSCDRYEFPDIFVAIIPDATIFGRTNLICTGGEVVCHDMYDLQRDSTNEELHGRVVIDPALKRIRWLYHDDKPEQITMAAAFVDACATNYAHWLTEVLPRIAAFCSADRFKTIPIVVDDKLHPNIMESLLLIAGAERKIIRLPAGRALCVQELYVTSATGYVPFGRRSNKLSGHSHGIFSPGALEVLRTSLVPLKQKNAGEACPEKIFIRRNSGTRGLANAAEIEGLLVTCGYVPAEPGTLSFMEQVRLFGNAKKIVAPTGAALTNAIFCKPGTQVVVLMGKHEDMIYRYWINLLGPLGINVSYVLGDITGNHGLGIHGDFSVASNCIGDLLKDFEK